MLASACSANTPHTPHDAHSAKQTSGWHYNQLGFHPLQPKVAVAPPSASGRFSIIDAKTGREVFTGELSAAKPWPDASGSFRQANFSDFTKPGIYRLRAEGTEDSSVFTLGETLLEAPLAAAIRYYYFNRTGAALEPRHAGPYARPASHPDTIVYVHKSAAGPVRQEGAVISAPKGWFDAGDFNKYIVNSAITVHTLLRTLENHPSYFAKLNLNIPESNNPLPDLLDEILWNLDWMVAMQDSDGGVYHKLTTKNFEPVVMPHTHYAARYVVQKSTAATLNFASTLALASRVLARYEQHLPGRAGEYQQKALAAWQWALTNPTQKFKQPRGFHTGVYALDDDSYQDEWAWARAELFTTTQDKRYLEGFPASVLLHVRAPEWGTVEAIALMTLANNKSTPSELKTQAQQAIMRSADGWVKQAQTTGYGVALAGDEFRWGSNSLALNKAKTLIQLHEITPNDNYLHTAQGLLDYVLGRNPVGISYVTGFGYYSANHPHHRVSEADDIAAAIPGMLVGGPHSGYQDKKDCRASNAEYDVSIPAKAYTDHWCSYATNEVAINWNASLVYALSYFHMNSKQHSR